MNRILSTAACSVVALVLSAPVLASKGGSTLRCADAVLNVPTPQAAGDTQYTVRCLSADEGAMAPTLVFSGELRAKGGAPYSVAATYGVDARQAYAKALDMPKPNAHFAGTLSSEVSSVKNLSALFEDKSHWDPKSATLSVEERAGLWRVVSVRFDAASGDPYVVEAGLSSVPVADGQGKADLIFSRAYSRFAAKDHERMPQVKALLFVGENGKLALEVEATRALNAEALSARIKHMDANPADVTRAWAVAAMARFMGFEQEAKYAAHQVAAHNPQLLDEFHADVQAIVPYVLPQN